MRDPSDTSEAAPPVEDNLVSGVGMMLARALSGNLDWRSDEFMHGVAAEDRSEQISIRDKLTARFPKEFRKGDWNELLGAAKRELKSSGREGLDTDGQGNVRPTHDNAAKLLENEPAWKGVISYNEFTGSIGFMKRPPSPVIASAGDEIADRHDTEITRWFERKGCYIKSHVAHAVIVSHAHKNQHHPPREYLRALKWDKKKRLSEWLFDYCGVDRGSDEKPNELAATIARMWCISAVARIMEPGCQADHVLVLEGKTGIGKTTAAKILGSGFYTAQINMLNPQKAAMQLRGVWIVELKEIDRLTQNPRLPENDLKAFIDDTFDRLVLPYGRYVEKFPRQCVFIGTTERNDWLNSETGRRYWPVWCHWMDTKGLLAVRDQLWAEAVVAYDAKEKWFLSDEMQAEAKLEQDARQPEDIHREAALKAIKEVLAYKMEYPNEFGLVEVMKAMGIATLREQKENRFAVGRTLASLSYKKHRVRRGDEILLPNGKWEKPLVDRYWQDGKG